MYDFTNFFCFIDVAFAAPSVGYQLVKKNEMKAVVKRDFDWSAFVSELEQAVEADASCLGTCAPLYGKAVEVRPYHHLSNTHRFKLRPISTSYSVELRSDSHSDSTIAAFVTVISRVTCKLVSDVSSPKEMLQLELVRPILKLQVF